MCSKSEMGNTFDVIRIEVGPKRGQVFLIPSKPGGYRIRKGVVWSRTTLRARSLLSCVSYKEAYYFACGLLQGQTGKVMSPYIKTGKSKVWKGLFR